MFLHHLPQNLVLPFLNMANTLIAADGVLSEGEKNIISQYAVELHLPELPELEVINYDDVLPLFSHLSRAEKKEIFFELLSLAYADSEYANEERKMLERIAAYFKLSKGDVEAIERITAKLMFDYEELGSIING